MRDGAGDVGMRIALALLILLLGWMVSAGCIGLGVWLLAAGQGGGFAGAGGGGIGAVLGIFVLVVERPWEMSVVLAGIAGVFLHAALAQKFVVQSLMNSVWRAGEARFLVPAVTRGVSALDRLSPSWMNDALKWGTLKANFLVALRDDPETGAVQKWAMRRLLAKLSLRTELPSDREGLIALLSEKIRSAMAEVVAPRSTLSVGLMGAQVVLGLIATVAR